jgi:hypothetical protein
VCVCVCVIRFDDVIRVLPPAPEVKRKQLMDLDDTKAQQVRSGGPVSPGGGGAWLLDTLFPWQVATPACPTACLIL